MDPNTAAAIVALRPALEGLIIRAAKDPECITEMTPLDDKVVKIIRQLCTFDAGRFGLQKIHMEVIQRPPRQNESFNESSNADDGNGPQPAKLMRGGSFGGGGYYNSSSTYSGSYGDRRGRGGFRGGYRGGYDQSSSYGSSFGRPSFTVSGGFRGGRGRPSY